MTMKLKKGFTLVELVVVIAVIVILSAILIPTFANVTQKANEAARDEALAGAEKMVLVEYPDLDRMNLVYEYKGTCYERNSDNKWVVKEGFSSSSAKQLVVAKEDATGTYSLTSGSDGMFRASYETATESTTIKYKITETFNTLKVYYNN